MTWRRRCTNFTHDARQVSMCIPTYKYTSHQKTHCIRTWACFWGEGDLASLVHQLTRQRSRTEQLTRTRAEAYVPSRPKTAIGGWALLPPDDAAAAKDRTERSGSRGSAARAARKTCRESMATDEVVVVDWPAGGKVGALDGEERLVVAFGDSQWIANFVRRCLCLGERGG